MVLEKNKLCNYSSCTNKAIVRGKCQKYDKEYHINDGTEKVLDFTDGDIIIDDQNNGSHHVDAQAFVPPSSNGDPAEEEGGSDKVEGKETLAEDNSPDSHHDSDEEDDLGTLIYRSSRMAKSIKK